MPDQENNVKYLQYLKTLNVYPERKIALQKDFTTSAPKDLCSKEEAEQLFQEHVLKLAELQDTLYAQNKHSVLIVLQAIDAAGKDSIIKHVYKGLNPQGVKVHSFKVPTPEELDHHFLWRHQKALPGRGEIGIFNRSHYENVIVTKVHPEYILNENLPDIYSTKDITPKFWKRRYKQINQFERTLAQSGTLILKFFLNVSKEEQKKRFVERIDDPSKNWKFSEGDIGERSLWPQYQQAYEDMLNATSTEYAPWFVLPADDKWFTRLCMGMILTRELTKLRLHYPDVSDEQRRNLQTIREQLINEP